MLLSAALIVRDEEEHLPGCLQSIRGVVDETVVVDTGSTDGTREIARVAGAQVHDFEWIDDFGAARNRALDRAGGRWILYIDADERLRPCDPARLRRLLEDESYVGHWVQLHAQPGFTPYPELRLFRNSPQIRFRGVIHESIWSGIQTHRSTHGSRIGTSGLVIDHLGYDGDQGRKHRRNLPLLERDVRQRPDRVFSWCHMARAYLALDRTAAAEEAWAAALDVVRRKGRVQVEDSLPYIGLIQWRASQQLDVESLLAEGTARFPKNIQLRWLQGRSLMKARRFADAVPVFEALLAAGGSGDYDPMSYDERLLDLLPCEALAACHFQLGNYAAAREYFGRAARLRPDQLEYRVKVALCARLDQDPSGRREGGTARPGVA